MMIGNNERGKVLLLGVNEAMERYSIGRTFLYELLSRPDAPKTYKLGNRRMIPAEEMDAFIFSIMEVAR